MYEIEIDIDTASTTAGSPQSIATLMAEGEDTIVGSFVSLVANNSFSLYLYACSGQASHIALVLGTQTE
jgi:hypothetical protein